MANKINLDEKLILNEYRNGKSSLVLSKEFNVSKPTILKILKNHNVIRKRDRCDSLDIKKNDEYYIIERICPICVETILTKAKQKTVACRNHFNKLNENRPCKKCSLELQVGEGNPFYGKKHTEKTKNQISKSRVGKGAGENNPMANPEHREKVRNALLTRIENNPITFSSRSKNEIKIYKKIKRKYNLTRHSETVRPYICDIFIPELNLIIEYYGDYWHCNPIKYSPDYYHKIKKRTAQEIWDYDKNKIDLIKENGYNLEIVWEKDYNQNPKIINQIIKKYVKKN